MDFGIIRRSWDQSTMETKGCLYMCNHLMCVLVMNVEERTWTLVIGADGLDLGSTTVCVWPWEPRVNSAVWLAWLSNWVLTCLSGCEDGIRESSLILEDLCSLPESGKQPQNRYSSFPSFHWYMVVIKRQPVLTSCSQRVTFLVLRRHSRQLEQSSTTHLCVWHHRCAFTVIALGDSVGARDWVISWKSGRSSLHCYDMSWAELML